MSYAFRLGFLSCLLVAQGICAQPDRVPAKGLRAHRTSAPVRIDGHLDETDWARAEVARRFTETWPRHGQAASLPTEVRVLVDDAHLYVGARMNHPEARAQIIKRLHRRDGDSQSDWFTVLVDSQRDRRTACSFSVNAAGVQKDGLHTGDSSHGDSSWDGVWESAVSSDANGWTAELRIPLVLLRIRASELPQTWGVNFRRDDAGPFRGTSYWEAPPQGVGAFVSLFPTLEGLEGLRPRPRREFLPYLSAQRKFETQREGDDRVWTLGAGLDARFGVRESGQVDLSLRPDFGQVEVDEAEINFTTIETYFPEKRPFFLEGMELFQVAQGEMLYSRRIGAALEDPELTEEQSLRGDYLERRALASEIQGALKYTDRFGSGLNLGVLGARVGAAEAHMRRGDGSAYRQDLAPATSYGVLRLQQALDEDGSYLGLFGGGVRGSGPLGRQASSQALDGVLRSRDQRSRLEFALSRTAVGPGSERRTGLRRQLLFRHDWGKGWTVQLKGDHADRTFDPNDLGYLDRADRRAGGFDLKRQWHLGWGGLQNTSATFRYNRATDQAGHTFQHWSGFNLHSDFTNFWSTTLEFGVNLPVEDDRELRTFQDPVKKYLRRERGFYYTLGFDTAGNRPWYINALYGRSTQGQALEQEAELRQVIKPGSAVELQLITKFEREDDHRSYLRPTEASIGAPLTGLRTLSEFNQELRISYALSTTLTVQLFTQWLLSSASYRDPQAYVSDRALTPVPLPVGMGAPESYRLWNLNLITRWEFRPGSTAFLVYTHGTENLDPIADRSQIRPWRDLEPLRQLKSDDAVQVKVSWLFR